MFVINNPNPIKTLNIKQKKKTKHFSCANRNYGIKLDTLRLGTKFSDFSLGNLVHFVVGCWIKTLE